MKRTEANRQLEGLAPAWSGVFATIQRSDGQYALTINQQGRTILSQRGNDVADLFAVAVTAIVELRSVSV